jgi:hypothetical protein
VPASYRSPHASGLVKQRGGYVLTPGNSGPDGPGIWYPGPADESVCGLTDAIGGAPPSNEITVDAEGTAGSPVSDRLPIENNHPESAAVRCSATQPMASVWSWHPRMRS